MSGELSSKVRQAFLSIEEVSIILFLEVYQVALSNSEYNLFWNEEQFTAYLVGLMKKNSLRKKYKLHIDIEKKLINYDALPVEDNDPKKTARIDINIASWNFKKNEELEYFFEAKNLYEKDIKKKVASSSLNRYIDTGIENFRVGKYYHGTLVGYILHGETSMIIDKLNIQLKKDRKYYESKNTLSLIEATDCVKDFSHCYTSKHQSSLGDEIDIRHIFLKF